MKHRKTLVMVAAALLIIGSASLPLWAQNAGKRGAQSRDYRERGSGSVANRTVRSESVNDYEFAGGIENVLAGIEPGILTEADREGILHMREEEKLARDVYLTLAEKWNIPVFANIARSEQTHMEAMELLIERYGLTDPVSSENSGSRGDYAKPEFDELYADLTARGLTSYGEALEAGALIEDLDIADLERLIGDSGNDDVKIVYQNLLKGSRNHLRAFTGQLARSDVSYSPDHLSKRDYDRIASSAHERGVITDPGFEF